MNGAEFVRTGLGTTTSMDELEYSWQQQAPWTCANIIANWKTSVGSISMKQFCHRTRVNSQLAPQTKKSSVCDRHTVIEILKDRTPDQIGACKAQMADHLAMRNKKQVITWERKLSSRTRQLTTFRVQHRPSLVPRRSKNGESTWYTLFVHALNIPTEFLRNDHQWRIVRAGSQLLTLGAQVQ